MRIGFIVGCSTLFCVACSPMSDEPDVSPTAPEPVVRYFTVTNADKIYSFAAEGQVVSPTETTPRIELQLDSCNYYIWWHIDNYIVPDTILINMKGQPAGITINYTVKYE